MYKNAIGVNNMLARFGSKGFQEAAMQRMSLQEVKSVGVIGVNNKMAKRAGAMLNYSVFNENNLEFRNDSSKKNAIGVNNMLAKGLGSKGYQQAAMDRMRCKENNNLDKDNGLAGRKDTLGGVGIYNRFSKRSRESTEKISTNLPFNPPT